MPKMESLRKATLVNSIGFAVLYFAVLGGKMYVEGAVEVNNASKSTIPAPLIVTTPPTETPDIYYDKDGDAMLAIPKSEQYTKQCRLSLNNYVYTAIVAHNMNQRQAQELHKKNRDFKQLAQNLSDTIMLFADQVGKMMYMFNTCEVNVTAPPEAATVAATATAAAATAAVVPPADHSEITVLSLLVVILALSCYIGYLSYKLKTKYYHNSSILIEEHH